MANPSKSSPLVELFDQILDGLDIPEPEGMLKVAAKSANARVSDFPYSIATNLKHTVFWQNHWLRKLKGGRQSSGMAEWTQDWKVPEPSEWNALRTEFLDGLREARAIAGSDPFVHGCDSDDEAIKTLCAIAIHASYHCGQINLMKRVSRKIKE